MSSIFDKEKNETNFAFADYGLRLPGCDLDRAMPADVLVFSDNFDGGQSFSSGVTGGFSGITTTESVQGYAGLGNGSNQFAGNLLRNITGGVPTTGTAGLRTVLTLNNLPSHTHISLSFLLATIDSWDGVDGSANATGDFFNVVVDGTEVFQASFAQLSGSPGAAYQAPSGGELSAGNNLFGLGIADGAYDMSMDSTFTNIAHSGSTLTIEMYADGPGWQGEQDFGSTGLPDESWGVDNVQVSLSTIPEPSSALLLTLGCAGLSFLRNRRRR